MKYAKMLGLLAVAAAALMAFAATASATTLTSPTGTTYTGEIHADSEGTTTLDGPANISCEVSTVSGNIEAHGSGVTASGKIGTLTFEKCNQDVSVVKNGELIIHPDPESTKGAGILTSSGALVKVQITGLGLTCEYSTEGTKLGTVTSSHETGGHATLHISGKIPRTGGSVFCGGEASWTGSYTVTKPATLYVD